MCEISGRLAVKGELNTCNRRRHANKLTSYFVHLSEVIKGQTTDMDCDYIEYDYQGYDQGTNIQSLSIGIK